MSTAFWNSVNDCLDDIEKAKTVSEVIGFLNRTFNADDYHKEDTADAFFPGSGGDRQMIDALREAGWPIVWVNATYYFMAQDTNGDLLTYIEGDVYRGDRR